jgi:Zn/Cd-binding protein ZinT
MEDFLSKIKNIKKSKLENLEKKLLQEKRTQLQSLVSERERLVKALTIKKTQARQMIESKDLLLKRKNTVKSRLEIKQEIVDKFYNDYFDDILRDDRKYSDLMKKIWESVGNNTGKLTIDKVTYDILKSEIPDSMHVIIDEQISGFSFNNEEIEIDATQDTLRSQRYEDLKPELYKILFSND